MLAKQAPRSYDFIAAPDARQRCMYSEDCQAGICLTFLCKAGGKLERLRVFEIMCGGFGPEGGLRQSLTRNYGAYWHYVSWPDYLLVLGS